MNASDRCGATDDPVRLTGVLGQAVAGRAESIGHRGGDVECHPVERDTTGIVDHGDGQVEAVAIAWADRFEHVPPGPDRHAGTGGIVRPGDVEERAQIRVGGNDRSVRRDEIFVDEDEQPRELTIEAEEILDVADVDVLVNGHRVVVACEDFRDDRESRAVGIAGADVRIARRDEGPVERRGDPHLRPQALLREPKTLGRKGRRDRGGLGR
jgi:hypothetical protein